MCGPLGSTPEPGAAEPAVRERVLERPCIAAGIAPASLTHPRSASVPSWRCGNPPCRWTHPPSRVRYGGTVGGRACTSGLPATERNANESSDAAAAHVDGERLRPSAAEEPDGFGCVHETLPKAASEALGARADDPRVLDALLAKLGSDDTPSVRMAAIDSLALAEPTPAATRLLVDIALTGADPGLRARAVSALEEYAGRGSTDARDGLTRVGESGPGTVSEQARRALEEVSS